MICVTRSNSSLSGHIAYHNLQALELKIDTYTLSSRLSVYGDGIFPVELMFRKTLEVNIARSVKKFCGISGPYHTVRGNAMKQSANDEPYLMTLLPLKTD